MSEFDFNSFKQRIEFIRAYFKILGGKLAQAEIKQNQVRIEYNNRYLESKKNRSYDGKMPIPLRTRTNPKLSIKLRQHGILFDKIKDAFGQGFLYRRNSEMIDRIETLTRDLMSDCNDVFLNDPFSNNNAYRLLGYFCLSPYSIIIEKTFKRDDVGFNELLGRWDQNNAELSRAIKKLMNCGLLICKRSKEDKRIHLYSLNEDLLNKISDYALNVTSLMKKKI